MEVISFVWNNLLIIPLTNLFVLFTTITGNAGFGLILLTVLIRVATFPLNLKQMRTTRAMTALAPRLSELQKRYTDPKRRSEEQMRLYREAGVSPLGCFSSMLIQMPILFALYRAFSFSIGEAPEALVQLSPRLYNWGYLRSSMPLQGNFLWLHLGQPDPIILPLLVASTTYVLQKMTMMPATDDKQRAQNSMMNLMMPLLFGWITINLISGLGLYYVLSNVIGIAMQYFYVGRGPINWRGLVGLSQEPVLPRMMELRQQSVDRINAVQFDDGKETQEESSAKQDEEPPARRRRRYSSGRRRGRR